MSVGHMDFPKKSIDTFNRLVEDVSNWSRLTDQERERVLQQIDRSNPWINLTNYMEGSPLAAYLRQQLGKEYMGGTALLFTDVLVEKERLQDDHRDLLKALKRYAREIQRLILLSHPGPASFTYKGFKVHNVDGLIDTRVEGYLEAIDYLVSLFKSRGVEPFIQTYQNWSVKILSLCLSQDQLDPKVVRLGHNGKGSKTSLRTVFSEEKFALQAGTLKPLIKIDRLHFATLAEPKIVSAK